MVMVMVMKEENQDEHYFVVVVDDLAHIVQLNTNYIYQWPEKEIIEKAVVLAEFHFALDSATLVILVDAPVILFGVPSAVVNIGFLLRMKYSENHGHLQLKHWKNLKLLKQQRKDDDRRKES